MRGPTFSFFRPVLAGLLAVCATLAVTAATYEVGPGLARTRLRDVPWANLQPGDLVNIHPTPGGYHEKIQISASGTAQAHIVIRGIPDPVTGALPVIDGQNAIEDPAYDPRHPKFTEWSVILVSPRAATYVYGQYHVSFVDIENLAIRNASYTGDGSIAYTDKSGTVRGYGAFASGIYVEWAHDLAIRGCEISECGNGIFANSKTQGGQVTRRLLIEGNYLHDNSNPPIPNPADPEGVPLSNGFGEHHIYVECAGSIIQYNRFGPLRAGARGTAIKNRSSGIIIRYNEFVMNGQSNVIAMPNAQGGTDDINLQPDYLDAYVYGNLITIEDYPGGMTAFMWGAFDGAPLYVEGHRRTLYIYNNTIINHHAGLALLLLSGASYTSNATITNPTYENVDIRNNVIYTDPALQANTYNAFRFTNSGTTHGGGDITLGKNWISPGWTKTAPAQTWSGALLSTENLIVGDADGLNDPHLADIDARDYHAVSGSNILDASGPLAPAASAFPVTREYLATQTSQLRPVLGSATDLGALESAGDPPLPRGVLQLSADTYSMLENAGSVTITVTRTGGSAGKVSIGVGTPGGGGQTATVNADYAPQSLFLTWLAGDTAPKTIAIPIVNDALVEPSETVRVIVIGPTGGATLGAISEATLTILDDDDTTPTLRQAWRTFHFGSDAANPLLAADTADPDADGRPNLLEYALGTDPLIADGPARYTVAVLPAPVSKLALSFQRIADPTLTYAVEASSDLVTWEPTSIWTSTGAQNISGPVTVTDTADLSTTPRRFLRLRISAQ
ncbi:MAG: hypothetical protein NTU80_07825 [Verrucomicrobia bacterium]|nr:hypothetical protein [Verrucomicrobiota bacterium]